MNWEAAGAIGELIGAAGVIASLVYVGYQIRQNTVATERTNARQTASEHGRALLSILDEDVAEIVLRGAENMDQLSAVERYRYDLVMAVWLESVEQAFADHRIGTFPKELMAEYINRVHLVMDTPGGRAWWEQRKAWLSPTFREEIDRLISEGSPAEMKSSRLLKPGEAT